MTTEPWASVEHVAKHLGVAKDSVYRLWKFKLSKIDVGPRRRGRSGRA
jgi:hypothetical protein